MSDCGRQRIRASVNPPLSLKTGQWHWRDQLGGLRSRSAGWASFFISFALAFHAGRRATRVNASLVGIGGLRRLTFIKGLADSLYQEHDEAAEPKAAFADSHGSEQKMAG